MHHALSEMGHDVDFAWHKSGNLDSYDFVALPGGFSYGDYLRSGAIAKFSPVMSAILDFANSGKPVLGVCNGFQILVETGLLPGALLRNQNLRFVCKNVYLRTENINTIFSGKIPAEKLLKIPVAHGEGRYYADPETIQSLNTHKQIVFRYATPQKETTPAANPNGSLENIAGIINREGNVLGMMPHPERAMEALLGSEDGRLIFESLTG